MQAHILAGHFSAGPRALFESFAAGAGTLRIESLVAEGDAAPSASLEELAIWLAEVPRGVVRRARGSARVQGSKALVFSCECFGAGPGRVLTGLDCAHPAKSEGGITFKDVELALLGVACKALAHESQGAVLIGRGLGPVGAGLPHGTIAEELLAALDLHGEAVDQIVLAPDTALHVPSLPGFQRLKLGDLVNCVRGA